MLFARGASGLGWLGFAMVAALGVRASESGASDHPTPSLSASSDRRVLAMGTELSIHLEGHLEGALVGDSPPALARASERAIREVDRIERACSTWRADSAWSQLNDAQSRAIPLASEWRALLSTALVWQQRTEGTFDPILGALVKAWGIRHGGRAASTAEVAAARADSGASLLRIDDANGTARLLRRNASVEEGGFVKGYALDRARLEAEAEGITRGWINFGGQILAWGDAHEAELAHPRERRAPFLRLILTNASLSTSATSERGRHIVDPRTGELAKDWGSASAIADDALSADVLSLALFVMGPDDGLRWANAQHVKAIFILNNGDVRTSDRFPAFTRVGSPAQVSTREEHP